MFELIFRLIFQLIIKIFSLLLSPLVGAVSLLFPDFSDLYSFVVDFLSNSVLNYTSLICDLLFIPRTLVFLLFDFYLVIFSIQTAVSVYKLVLNVYNKLKP